MPARREAKSPFPGVRPHFQSDRLGVYFWFTSDPDGWICRYTEGTHLSAETATFVATQAEPVLLQRFPSTPRFLFIQDFSDMVGYDAEARKIYTEFGRRIAKRTISTIVIPPPLNPIFRMGLSAALMALKLGNVSIDTCPSLDEAIRKFKLKPAL